MKTDSLIFAVVSVLLVGCASSSTPPVVATPPVLRVSPFASDVRGSDVIAIVSVGQVVGTEAIDATGHRFSIYAAEATLEKILKGNPPVQFRIEEEVGAYDATPIDPFRLKAPKSVMGALGTSRWLVFLKKTGDHYTATDAQSLCSVWGTGSGGRVIWRSVCLSMGETEAMINKSLASK